MLPDSRVKKTVAPRVLTLKKPSVLAEMRMGAVEPEGSYDTIRIEGQHAADAISDWTLTTFLDCSLENLTFETVLFDHAAITSTRFAGCGMVHSSFVNASICSSTFEHCRFGACDAWDCETRSVIFTGCRFGYLNLRGAKWHDVVFQDCVIDDFDAAHAVLGRIAFPGTTIHAINLQHAVADDVDLRGAELQEIHDVAGLRGTTMLVDQISQLAQSFAASLGIRLEEPEG